MLPGCKSWNARWQGAGLDTTSAHHVGQTTALAYFAQAHLLTQAMPTALCTVPDNHVVLLQVIPFLVLAVGVDNMFILAHALQQQDPQLPVPERLGRALAGAGPSITLAAACETLAFGLGGLTSMPAVRNFSLCAAVAVLLDYALQVKVNIITPMHTSCPISSAGHVPMRSSCASYTCIHIYICINSGECMCMHSSK